MDDRTQVAQAVRKLSADQVARYVADLTTELQQMASGRRFATLRYLLDVARLEAEEIERALLGRVGDAGKPPLVS